MFFFILILRLVLNIMADKVCSKCFRRKSSDLFYRSKRNRDGRIEKCKECSDIAREKYYDSEKELAYNNLRRESQKVYSKYWHALNPEQKQQLKIDKQKLFDSIIDAKQEAIQARKDLSYRIKALDRLEASIRKELRQIESINVKIKAAKRAAEFYYHQYHNDPIFKLKEVLKRRTQKIFKRKNWATPHRCGQLLGASFEIVKAHIEKQFTLGMNWDNHGTHGWHIDHRIPLASAKTEDEVYPLFHYTNLQPLWAADNILKSDKIINYV